MKWNRQSAYLVALIFAVSYLYSLKYEYDISSKIKAQSLQSCKKQKHFDCRYIEKNHDLCFGKSYRSQFRAMHFFQNEYNACMRKKRLP